MVSSSKFILLRRFQKHPSEPEKQKIVWNQLADQDYQMPL